MGTGEVGHYMVQNPHYKESLYLLITLTKTKLLTIATDTYS